MNQTNIGIRIRILVYGNIIIPVEHKIKKRKWIIYTEQSSNIDWRMTLNSLQYLEEKNRSEWSV